MMYTHMKVINPITMSIIRNVRNEETIHELTNKIGFAYSAVYKWVYTLKDYGVLELRKEGNKTFIRINESPVYKKFNELCEEISVIDKDKAFWKLMKRIKLKVRFVRGTVAVIWTQGNYVTGDFYDRIYYVEVFEKDFTEFKGILKKYNILYCIDENKASNKRPLICIKQKKSFRIEHKNGLPVMPLKELVVWCRKLFLEPILEQLDLMYGMGLKIRYSEVYTNVR